MNRNKYFGKTILCIFHVIISLLISMDVWAEDSIRKRNLFRMLDAYARSHAEHNIIRNKMKQGESSPDFYIYAQWLEQKTINSKKSTLHADFASIFYNKLGDFEKSTEMILYGFFIEYLQVNRCVDWSIVPTMYNDYAMVVKKYNLLDFYKKIPKEEKEKIINKVIELFGNRELYKDVWICYRYDRGDKMEISKKFNALKKERNSLLSMIKKSNKISAQTYGKEYLSQDEFEHIRPFLLEYFGQAVEQLY